MVKLRRDYSENNGEIQISKERFQVVKGVSDSEGEFSDSDGEFQRWRGVSDSAEDVQVVKGKWKGGRRVRITWAQATEYLQFAVRRQCARANEREPVR